MFHQDVPFSVTLLAEMIGDSKIEVHDDDTLEYEEGSDKSDEETIESIMAKAKAFEDSDESEN